MGVSRMVWWVVRSSRWIQISAEPVCLKSEKIKENVERLSGVSFELRTLRRTYGQMLLDSGPSIETASIALGHRSIKTTQAHYCQESLDTVNSQVLRALEDAMPGTPGT